MNHGTRTFSTAPRSLGAVRSTARPCMRIWPTRTLLASVGYICFVSVSQAAAQTPIRHALIELRPARVTPSAGYSVVKSASDTTFYLTDTALISDDDIAGARTDSSARNGLFVEFRLRTAAAARVQQFTRHHLGERLALLLSGELNGTPARIADEIPGTVVSVVRLPTGNAHRFAAAVAARWRSGL
jgi:preprotein translocase subunit SecD